MKHLVNGVAIASPLTANGTTGSYVVTASAAGVAAVAKGDAEIAIQPVSELLHVAGSDFVGTILPAQPPVEAVGTDLSHRQRELIDGIGGLRRQQKRKCDDGDYGPRQNAATLAPVLRELAPDAELVVGMSLGGLTAIRLAVSAPELVRELVLVDVTPSAPERHIEMTDAQRGTVALVQGERIFPSFAAMLDVTVAAAPHRDRESLRRGVFHNSKRLDDGTWTWRYDSIRTGDGFVGLWDDVPALTTPTTLVRGGNSVFVSDEDAAAFARAAPGFRGVRVVENSGHSVQSDQPRLLIDILRQVIDA